MDWWTWTWWETIVVFLLAIIALNTLLEDREDYVTITKLEMYKDIIKISVILAIKFSILLAILFAIFYFLIKLR
jgi:uncharacterized protein HemY